MRGVLVTAIICFFITACTRETETAIALGVKAKQCQDFEIARHEVLSQGHQLTKEEIDQVIEINSRATVACTTQIPGLTEQLREFAP